MNKKKLILVTTVPQTIYYILKDQPKYLSNLYDVRIVTSPGPEVSKIKKREEVDIYEIDMKRKISLFSDLISLYKLTKLFIGIRPEIVHSFTPKAGLLAMLAAFFSRVRLRIHTFTGLIFPSRKGFSRKLLIFTDKLTALCATNVIAESIGVRDELKSVNGFFKDIHIIRYGNIAGVDKEFFFPASENEKNSSRKKFEIPIEAFVFCYIGRLNYEKGIAELVETFYELSGNVYLIIVGDMDSSSPLDKKTIDLIDSHPKILNLGSREDVKTIYSLADVNVMPSHREGFSNVILEACSMGIPSISTNVNGSREVILEKETGWLVPIKDKKILKKALIDSMDENTNLKILGINCRKLVENRFSRDDYLNSLKSFYNKLV